MAEWRDGSNDPGPSGGMTSEGATVNNFKGTLLVRGRDLMSGLLSSQAPQHSSLWIGDGVCV